MRRIAASVLVLLGLVLGLIGALEKGTAELPVYTTGAARMLAGEEVYRPDDSKPFSYPPLFALPFVPLVPFGAATQRGLGYGVNVLLVAASLLLLARAAGPVLAGATRRRVVGLWLVVAALAARHVLAVFQNQSHDLWILFALSLATVALARGHRLLAGACAGLGAALKATPLLFLVPFAARRAPAPVLGVVLGAGAGALLPDLLFPRADGRLWIVAWYEIMVSGIGVGDTAARQGVWHAASWLNQSLSGTLYRLTTPIAPADTGPFVQDACVLALDATARKAVTVCAQLAIVLLVGLPCLRRPRSDGGALGRSHDALGMAGLVACGMVLLSPMSSKSHFCVLLVPAIACAANALFRRGGAVAWSLLGATFVLGTLTTKGIVGRAFGESLLAHGAVTWATLLLLLATAWGMRAGSARRG